jgi:hypothetical protein
MNRIRYTLVTDGPSDRLLRFPIDWLLERLTPLDFDGEWANPAVYGPDRAPRLVGRLDAALKWYPCQLLFVHRDAEREPRAVRVNEIEDAMGHLHSPPSAVCVVPVRMTEAWLLINEDALREAAGNPNGRAELSLPAVSTLESVPDPKNVLFNLLRSASELRGRRRRGFREAGARQRLAELIDDFSPLERLPAFRSFRTDLERVLGEQGWT